MVKASIFANILGCDYKIRQKILLHWQYKPNDGASNASPFNKDTVNGFKLTLCLDIMLSMIYILTIIY